MAQIQIPKEWCAAVCAVLETEDTTNRIIRWTGDARTRYEGDFFDSWPYQVYFAIRTYLESEAATGCQRNMDKPAGETYEFFFAFSGKKTYGKILLQRDRERIVLFSAHLPAREKLSCE
ncbi:MAG: hypothetical protein HQ559_18205 [Lentisphaerae bacterium]|nr:hypothetical protein [Lentisphaerota bacterium]